MVRRSHNSLSRSWSLVIFDCDGVLVDSETIGLSVLAALLRQAGVRITDQHAVNEFRGVKLADCLEAIEIRHGIHLPPTFAETYRASAAERFKTDLKAVSGVVDVLKSLTFPTCVASSAPMEKIRLSLLLTGLSEFFEGNIFSAYDVGAWKPDPTLFITACNAMGATPNECVVIEDSVVGVRAANAAGMTVFGYAEPERFDELEAEGAIPFSKMSDLINLLVTR